MPSKSADPAFVHLHVHSAYSLLEGAITIPRLAKLAVAHGFPAVGLTDSGNLFGALEFSEKLAGQGIQPIAGLELSVVSETPDPTSRAGPPTATNIVLLARSPEGYGNLMRLARTVWRLPSHRRPYDVRAEPASIGTP